MIFLIARGNAAGRALAVLFLILAARPLPLVTRMVAERQLLSACCTGIGFVLEALAVWPLFTRPASNEFA